MLGWIFQLSPCGVYDGRAGSAVVAPGAIAHVLRESNRGKFGAVDHVGCAGEHARQGGSAALL